MTQQLARSSRSPGLRFPPPKTAAPDSRKRTIARGTRAGWEKNAATPPQPRMARPRSAHGRRQGDEHQPTSAAARLLASLLPSEIVWIKPVQVVKLDRVVVTRRMQHHAVRRRACLFVADIGVAYETSMVVDGSPPARAVPNQLAEADAFRSSLKLARREACDQGAARRAAAALSLSPQSARQKLSWNSANPRWRSGP
jgi:hypothetical protein